MKKQTTPKKEVAILNDFIAEQIYSIRGERVMLDSDLAKLYEVETKNLNKAVKRNINRFPKDFMFCLTKEEAESLKSQIITSDLRFQIGTSSSGSQIATLNKNYGGRRFLPYAFTEQGVTMLASVLKSERAVQVSIAVVRIFVRIRQILSANKELAHKLEEFERTLEKHENRIHVIFETIRQFMNPEVLKKERIGFNPDKK